MLPSMNAELVCITATMLTLVSFLMKGERKIRLFNIVATVMFVIYGLLLNSYFLCVINIVLLGVHIYRVYVITEQTKYLKSRMGTLYTHDNKYIKKIEEEEQ